ALESSACECPLLPKFVSGVAEMDHELRKRDTALRRDDRRALLLCILAGTGFLAAMGAVYRDAPTVPGRTVLAQDRGEDLTTGSIVFVPRLGNRCRNRLID